ncbi:hypothetical protein LZ30DRAFT_271280 [Colletotrichum cereale]|nr:hypothetical protein LZ30DRAFT_271280 [Colletotrichum cereale]
MNEPPVEDDRSGAGPKYICERREEKKIRRRLLQSAFFSDILAVALVIALCTGGWTRDSDGRAANAMSGDSHLVTWSAACRRNETGSRATFSMSWFLRMDSTDVAGERRPFTESGVRMMSTMNCRRTRGSTRTARTSVGERGCVMAI